MKLIKENVKSSLLGLVYHNRLPYFCLIFSIVIFTFIFYIGGKNVAPLKNILPKNENTICQECLKVYMLDVGQGDSFYIQAPNGNSLLIDAGQPNGGAQNKISKIKNNFFDRTIDVLLATHPDADHIGGFENILKGFVAGLYVDPGVIADTAIYKNLKKEISEQRITSLVFRRGVQIILDKERNIYFETLYPDNSFFAYKYNECEFQNSERKRLHKKGSSKKCKNVFKLETNEMSIVGKLVYGKTSFLFTGDAPDAVENFLMKEFKNSEFRSNVLKVGHHGSKYSTSQRFAEIVEPSYAAISVGVKNRYGHPAERVLETLHTISTKPEIVRTDQVGTMVFISDGVDIKMDNSALSYN